MTSKVVLDTGILDRQTRTRYRFEVLESHQSISHSEEKVSYAWSIPKNWLCEPDIEPKNGLDPGSTEPVSRYGTTLLPTLYKSKTDFE